MATIKVNCGINNPKCSPSRAFEIETLDFERSHMTNQQLELNAKLLCILANCTSIIRGVDINRTIADITIVDNSIFYRIIGITKLINTVDNFKPFSLPLDYIRAVNDCLYKTENERAFAPQQWKTLIEKSKHLQLYTSQKIGDVFIDGLTTVYNGDNDKVILVPTSSVIKTFNITEKELYYGVSIKCNNEELILCEQEWENLTLEIDEVVRHKPNTELFDSAMIGVIAAFME
jgi:hypothetical protein